MVATKARPAKFASSSVVYGPDKSAHKFLLAGPNGSGKTYFVSTIERVFLLSVDEGLKGACQEKRFGRFPEPPRTWAELDSALLSFRGMNLFADEKAQKGPRIFQHLAIDGIPGVERVIHKEACVRERVPHMEAKDWQAVWKAALPVWDDFFATLESIRQQGTHIWLVGEASGGLVAGKDDDERWVKRDVMVAGNASTRSDPLRRLRGWADHILFLDYVDDTTAAPGTSLIGRCSVPVLITRDYGTHAAKTRSLAPPVLPAAWKDFASVLRGDPSRLDGKLRTDTAALIASLKSEDYRKDLFADLEAVKSKAALTSVWRRAVGVRAIEEAERGEQAEEATKVGVPDPSEAEENEQNDTLANPTQTTAPHARTLIDEIGDLGSLPEIVVFREDRRDEIGTAWGDVGRIFETRAADVVEAALRAAQTAPNPRDALGVIGDAMSRIPLGEREDALRRMYEDIYTSIDANQEAAA